MLPLIYVCSPLWFAVMARNVPQTHAILYLGVCTHQSLAMMIVVAQLTHVQNQLDVNTPRQHAQIQVNAPKTCATITPVVIGNQ